MKMFNLPENFLFGTATSGFQIEGNNFNSSWSDWINLGRIKNSLKGFTFCDHWNRISGDIELLKKMNSKIYRMSIEWSRIEPQNGFFDKKSMDHYRNEIIKIKNAGIEPLVTLHHFSNPLWFEKKGAWINRDSVRKFIQYVEYVVSYLSDLVQDWITINEPNVYLTMGYLKGDWPPGKKLSLRYYIKGAKNMIRAHSDAYFLIHKIGDKKNIKMNIGVAHHIRDFKARTDFFLNKKIVELVDYYFHDLFIKHMTINSKPLNNLKVAAGSLQSDFLGINYYTGNLIGVSLNPFKNKIKINLKDSYKNDLGWSINPEGLFSICKKYYQKYKLPIYITENGVCDQKDRVRIKFIYDHVLQIKKLIDIGIVVQRYYHWSLMDNFEWLEGTNARFGLIQVNYNTLQRIIKKSGLFYAELSKNNGITKEMTKKY